MLSYESMLMLALSSAGALFVGFCFYFDRKRTSAPDYKKRVHERRERLAMARKTVEGVIEEDDEEMQMRMRFVEEVQKGECLIKEGRVDEGLIHLCNAIMLCTHPGSLVQMLRANLPDALFRALMMRLEKIAREREDSSEDASDDTSYTSQSGAAAAAFSTAARQAGF